MNRLNLIIDSMNLSTVSANLVKLAAEYPLNITITGTLEECVAKRDEILRLLAPIEPTFIFGIGGDLTKFASNSLIKRSPSNAGKK
jgi:hypothetical protein